MTKPLALVTGTPGWLGTRLVQVLLLGLSGVSRFERPNPDLTVRCLALPGQDVSALRELGSKIEIMQGDITKADSLNAFFADSEGATLFHSAGMIHPKLGVRQFFRVNAKGTRNVVEHAKRAGVRRMVHVSSNSPIGVNPCAEHLFDESSPYNPYMGYGKSKKLAEDIVNAAFLSGDLETVIIRPPWFYGPCQPARQTLFFSMIKNGKGPIVGDGLNRRSMAYVDNICQGLMLCESVDAAAGQTYWIADRRAYTMNEIVDTIEEVLEEDFGLNVAHKRLHLPGAAGDIAETVDRILQSLGIYQQKIHVLGEMNKTIACTIKKAERELGYSPKIELRDGMRQSIRWILDNGMTI
jgi:nucleoside-diphosphate-sugar epimerase